MSTGEGEGATLTLDTWVQFKRRFTPILICCEADRETTQAVADRMNVAAQQMRTGGLRVVVEVNELIPAGFAFFKPPKYSADGTWPVAEHEQFKIVRLTPKQEQEQASAKVQGDEPAVSRQPE